MYYVCNIHKLNSKLVAVDICDSTDGIVEYIPINKLKDYKHLEIDGVLNNKIKVSDIAKDFERKCYNKVMKHILAGTFSDYDEHNKYYISLIDISFDYGDDTNKIKYNNNNWRYLYFELALVFNLYNDNKVNLVSHIYVMDEEGSGSYIKEDFQVLDIPFEFIKILYNCTNTNDTTLLLKVLCCYFHNLGGLYKVSIGTRDYHIHKDILDISFDDDRIDISICLDEDTIEV